MQKRLIEGVCVAFEKGVLFTVVENYYEKWYKTTTRHY
jgi:hypothetical protein